MSCHCITFITPLFSKGSYGHQPEIRPPSIRGQLHWWFRALGGSHADEKIVFGGVHDGPAASKIVVRVANITGNTGNRPTLPHKRGGEASPKTAYLPETTFDLHISERLGGLDGRLSQSFHRALEAWLLAGTLGLRATRAGGSFAWKPLGEDGVSMPATPTDYATRLKAVFQGAPLWVTLLNKSFTSAEDARHCVSNTLGGRDDHQGSGELARLRNPLGKVSGGRKTSPLRFRIVKLGSSFHIIAVWDNRSAVTGNQPGDLQAVVNLLARKKEIGQVMNACF